MTCKDCIYYEVCPLGLAVKGSTGTCLKFKNKADFVEVVRCGDCRCCQKVNDMDNGHWECILHFDWHGRPFLPDINGFCSYGERRENENHRT